MTAVSLSAAAARNRCAAASAPYGSWRRRWRSRSSRAGGIPAPGMQNCFYVLLPYLGEVVAAASVVWALAKLGTDWREVREYNYEKSVAVLPVRTVVTAGFAALGIVCEGIFFFANKPADKALFALLYVLLKLIVLLCALGVRAKIMQAEWDKIPKKDKS